MFDHHLHFEKYYTMTEGEDTSSSSQRRRIKYWVTDACYMSNCHKIAIASTGRDIRFFDVTSSFFYEEFHLYSKLVGSLYSSQLLSKGIFIEYRKNNKLLLDPWKMFCSKAFLQMCSVGVNLVHCKSVCIIGLLLVT